jgi:microcystin degradation protein MlrC
VDRDIVRAAETGATHFRLGEPAMEIDARVVWAGEGRYRARGRSYTGQTFSVGRTVVLATGRLRIVVSEAPAFGADPAFYEAVGLAPDTALAVHAKSLMGWRAGFQANQERGLVFDGPGCTSLEFARLPYQAGGRDLFPITMHPLNPITLWQSS